MRLKSSNSLFRILLWLVCFWFAASAQEVVLLYGVEDIEREIKLIFFSKSSVKISAVGIGPLGTTDGSGKLEKPIKVKNETLILKFQKEGYLERTKILRLTDTRKNEFTQTIILEPDKTTTTEAAKAQLKTIKTQEDEKEEFIKLRIPKEEISKLSSDEINVPISLEEGKLKAKIRELLSDESKKINVSIGLEEGEPVAKMRMIGAQGKTNISIDNQDEMTAHSADDNSPSETQVTNLNNNEISQENVEEIKVSSDANPIPKFGILVIDDSNNKISDADVKVNGVSMGLTDKDGKLLFDPPEKAEKIKIEVFKDGYEQISSLEEIDPKSVSCPLSITLKRLPTVSLDIQVNYAEGLLFSTPEFQAASSPYSNRRDYLWAVFKDNCISLPEKGQINQPNLSESRWQIADNKTTYILRQEEGQLYIYQEGKPVANALVQINSKEEKTNEHGRVTLLEVSIPTAEKLNVKVSKGPMYKEVKEIVLNSQKQPITLTLDPKWLIIKVSGKAGPLSNAEVWLNGNQHIGTTGPKGKIIIPVEPSLPIPSEYNISAGHNGAIATKLSIQENRKVYLHNITLD